MNKLPDKSFDKSIRDALEHYDVPFNPDDWLLMEEKLDEKPAPFSFILNKNIMKLMVAALITLSGLYGFRFIADSINHDGELANRTVIEQTQSSKANINSTDVSTERLTINENNNIETAELSDNSNLNSDLSSPANGLDISPGTKTKEAVDQKLSNSSTTVVSAENRSDVNSKSLFTDNTSQKNNFSFNSSTSQNSLSTITTGTNYNRISPTSSNNTIAGDNTTIESQNSILPETGSSLSTAKSLDDVKSKTSIPITNVNSSTGSNSEITEVVKSSKNTSLAESINLLESVKASELTNELSEQTLSHGGGTLLTQIPTVNKAKQKQSTYLTASSSADINSGFSASKRAGITTGLSAGWQITPKFSIGAGMNYSKKLKESNFVATIIEGNPDESLGASPDPTQMSDLKYSKNESLNVLETPIFIQFNSRPNKLVDPFFQAGWSALQIRDKELPTQVIADIIHGSAGIQFHLLNHFSFNIAAKGQTSIGKHLVKNIYAENKSRLLTGGLSLGITYSF